MLLLEPNPGQPSPRKCKVKPRLEDISSEAFDADEDVYIGRVYMYGPTYLPATTGQMVLTAKMAANLNNLFGLELEVGIEYPLTRTMLKYT